MMFSLSSTLISNEVSMVLVCTPNNSTVPALRAAELEALVDGVPDDVLVLVDEAYLDFVTDPAVGDALTLLGRHPNLVVSRTFSKAHALAGMRVGYLVGESGIISAIRSVATPFGVCLPAQAAALAALEPAALAETARRAGRPRVPHHRRQLFVVRAVQPQERVSRQPKFPPGPGHGLRQVGVVQWRAEGRLPPGRLLRPLQ